MSCKKCNGTRWYSYDENHSKLCEACCLHNEGWWDIKEGFVGYQKGADNRCCRTGCGTMKRDLQKYVVFKRDDTVRALSEDEIKTLAALNNKVNAYRLSTIRIPLQCVVVEEGWPMYEATWEAIETWVDHKALRKDLEDLKKNAGLL